MAQSIVTRGEKLMAQLQLQLERIYLKDASFESPQSPAVFAESWQPEMRLDINTSTNSLPEDRVEVILRATVEAQHKTEGTVAFICEVQQAGVFLVEGDDLDAKRRALGTVCPNMLFPYVREVMDSMVVKGGFPALQLAPVNFDALFAQAMQQQDGDDSVTH